MRVIAVLLISILAWWALTARASEPGGTVAVSFMVSWEMQSNEDLVLVPERSCAKRSVYDGFLEVVTIREANGDILYMQTLEGPFEGGFCEVPIKATLPASAGYTVWHENTYLASIPGDGNLGDNPVIDLSD